MTRRSALALFALMLPTLAVLAGPSTQPAKVPAFVDVGYTDGTTDRKFNLSADDLAFLRSAFPAKPADPPETPAEPPPPPLPSLTMLVAPSKEPRGDGVTLRKANPTLANAWVQGWRQNITAVGIRGTVTLENVRTLDAWRADPKEAFVGQGVYADDVDRLVVRELYGDRCGWREGLPPADRNGFRHVLYSNFAVKELVVEDSWLDEAACCLIQTRGPVAAVRRCLLTRGAIALLAVMGDPIVENCTIYDGHGYYQPAVKDGKGKVTQAACWTGNTAIQTYTTLRTNDVWIVGHPDQGKTPTLVPGMKAFNLGAVLCGSKYTGSDKWKAPKGPDGKPPKSLIVATNCRIAGWPGPTFAGDKPADGSGWTVAGGPVDAWPLLEPIRANLLANKITVREAVARGQAAVRGLVELQSK